MKFNSKFAHFRSSKSIWKCRLENGDHLVPASIGWHYCSPYKHLNRGMCTLPNSQHVADWIVLRKHKYAFSAFFPLWNNAGVLNSFPSKPRLYLTYRKLSVACLQMSWWHKEPGHPQQWYIVFIVVSCNGVLLRTQHEVPGLNTIELMGRRLGKNQNMKTEHLSSFTGYISGTCNLISVIREVKNGWWYQSPVLMSPLPML